MNDYGVPGRVCRLLYCAVNLLADSRHVRWNPAGVRCPQLTADNRCRLFGLAERPTVCLSLRPSEEMCCAGNVEALEQLAVWERLTQPDQV